MPAIPVTRRGPAPGAAARPGPVASGPAARGPEAGAAASYNYDRFPTFLIYRDLARSLRDAVRPGELAPDFDLETVDGSRLRLSDLRGRPVLLHFGSLTWPLTAGGVPALKALHAEFGDRVRFVTVVVREAHPGRRYPAHRTMPQKLAHARDFAAQEAIPWTVAVDDLEGSVHRRYGQMPDNAVLVDADGRVAYEAKWTHGPSLRRALAEPVEPSVDRRPHLLSAVRGRHAVPRGGEGAVRDLAVAALPALGAVALVVATLRRGRPARGPAARW
jgi:hypothetical protein